MYKNDKSRKNSQPKDKALDTARSFAPPSSVKSDALGSYTGYAERQPDEPVWDWDEGPTQDADDL